MKRYRIIPCATLLTTILLPALPNKAQELLRTFNLATAGTVAVESELVVKANGSPVFSYAPLAPELHSQIAAWDISRGTELVVTRAGSSVRITLPKTTGEKAETRLRIEEKIPSTGLSLHRMLPKGRYIFHLPAGYILASCSLPTQVETAAGIVTVGVVQGSDVPASMELTLRKGTASAPSAFKGNFTAQDNRIVSYQLLDPEDHRIRLWLEMYVDTPGQSHFYSPLRIPDHTSDPITLDVDRGVELPTRIVSGKEANAIGDSPSPFPEDGLILVADLGYSIPAHGSARLRSFQTATDPEGYRLVGPDDLRLDRFISRTRTQYILPAGWSLTSIDQPGVISSLPDGRIVIDFVGASAQAARLTLFAHRDTPPAN